MHVPSLRERRADILELARYFLERHRTVRALKLSLPAAEALGDYDWPGNVRELERLIERAVALAQSDVIELDDLPVGVRGAYAEALVPSLERNDTLRAWGARYVRLILDRCQGNKREACRVLDISYHSLVSYLRFLGRRPRRRWFGVCRRRGRGGRHSRGRHRRGGSLSTSARWRAATSGRVTSFDHTPGPAIIMSCGDGLDGSLLAAPLGRGVRTFWRTLPTERHRRIALWSRGERIARRIVFKQQHRTLFREPYAPCAENGDLMLHATLSAANRWRGMRGRPSCPAPGGGS